MLPMVVLPFAVALDRVVDLVITKGVFTLGVLVDSATDLKDFEDTPCFPEPAMDVFSDYGFIFVTCSTSAVEGTESRLRAYTLITGIVRVSKDRLSWST